MARVAIPGIWRGLTDGAAHVDCEGTTVLEVLNDLARRHPLMHDRLFSKTSVVQVFLNNRRVTDLQNPVTPHDEILLLMAIAGG
ncbi:MAG TPA: MoaD/ThiS family protein [Symbiobacteriaceae bacterium]|nr:MoaD/ThiS family protein [Symbiobacteriaceae bacterium]